MSETRLLTFDEVSALLRVPVATLRVWRHRGTGPQSFRLGRRVVFREDAVHAWVAEREHAEQRNRATA